MKRRTAALLLAAAFLGMGAIAGVNRAVGQTVLDPAILVEQLDGQVVEACGLTLALRPAVDEPHVLMLRDCPLFRDGFEP